MNYNLEIINKTKEFVKNAFQENPHYSFNHWSVMYDHSIKVQEIATKIAKDMDCNKNILAISALLHDIGKTFKADSKTLHKNHESFNFIVSEKFLKSLNLKENEINTIRDIISYKSDLTEMKIIKDADTLAFYFDKRLYMLFIKWAFENGFESETSRKLGKYDFLNFDISKKLGKNKREEMKEDWEEYEKNKRK